MKNLFSKKQKSTIEQFSNRVEVKGLSKINKQRILGAISFNYSKT